MKKVPPQKYIKHNLVLGVMILNILFYALPPTSVALAIPGGGNSQSAISRQNSQAGSQENNNGNIGKGQEKPQADNSQNDSNHNKGKNSLPGQENAKQGNNNQGNPSNNGVGPNNQPGNNGSGNPNGKGQPDGNGDASTDKDNNKGNDNLNADGENQERRGLADTAESIVDAIGRGTRDAAEVLKSIPAKIVPAAVEAAEYLGAALADKLEDLADFIQGIFGAASPAMVSESTGMSGD